MEHGAAALSALVADRSGYFRPAILAAVAGVRDDDRGLEWLYRRTLVGRAFLAISEDNYAARALGLLSSGCEW